MALNHIKFIKKMLDRYHDACYPTLSDDFIADVVSEVLQEAPDSYFTYDMVQEHPEFCKQCGACCSTIDCQYFNGKTCDEYATRWEACPEFPFYEIDYKAGLMLDPGCNFAMELAKMVLDEKLKGYIKLLKDDNDDS